MSSENYYLLDDMAKYDRNFNKDLYVDMDKKKVISIFKEYYKNNLPVDLLTWCRVNEPSEEMIYKDGYWKQIIFIRDTIMGLLSKSYEEYKNNPALVISAHRSKSIVLPVYQINLHNKNTKMIIRDNFYDWKISVDSNIEINIDFMGLFKEDQKINSVYCEGFEEEWVFDSYNKNKKQFTVEIGDMYQVYTFMFLLKNYLNNINEK